MPVTWLPIPLSFYFNSREFTYSVVLVSGAPRSDAARPHTPPPAPGRVTSGTLLHPQPVPVPRPSPLVTGTVFSVGKGLVLGLSLFLFFPLRSFVLFLRLRP